MIKLGKLQIDPIEYAINGNAILGIKDSGKTYTATVIAEQLFLDGIPFTVFDPTGVWRYLKIPGAGRGYPIVVAADRDGDFPLTVHTAPEIVRAAMADGISLVLDLSGVDFSKADWRKIVTSCINVMLHENKQHGLRHLFIEEAAEFIPQKPTDFVVYGAVEKLARIGGNARLGYTLINQRSQEVAKSVLELCESVFLHRQRGKNALDNLSKWLEIASDATAREIIKEMPTLPQGECYAWIGGKDPKPPVRIEVQAKTSMHPDRRVLRGEIGAGDVTPADASHFIEQMKASLPRLEQQRQENDPAALKAEIARLRAITAGDPAAVAIARQEGFQEGVVRGRQLERNAIAGAMSSLETNLDQAMRSLQATVQAQHKVARLLDPPADQQSEVPAPHTSIAMPGAQWTAREAAAVSGRRPPIVTNSNGAGEKLPKAERLILTALAQHGGSASKRKVALLAGYAIGGGGFNNALAALRNADRIAGSDPLLITNIGRIALGRYEPLPHGRALLDHWTSQLGKAERHALTVLMRAYPATMSKERLADEIGYAPNGGGFNNALSKLRTLELINGRGELKASAELFG